MPKNFEYEITEELGEISEEKGGWVKELNLISWNGRTPKYDIRDWYGNHEKMGKGITLSEDEARELYCRLADVFGEEDDEDSDETNYPESDAAWLLTWNPDRFYWEDIAECAEATQNGYCIQCNWSCVNTHVKPGDRVYLIMLGRNIERGIIASGFATSEPYEDEHWEDSKHTKSRVKYIDVDFDMILNPNKQKPLSKDVLMEQFPKQTWSPQGSGISILDEYVDDLHSAWTIHTINVFLNGGKSE